MSAWSEPSSEQRGWPRKATPFNPVLRLTGGLSAAYEATRGSRFRPAAAQPQLETSARGRLVLSPTMPMIARRYRYMHTVSESDLSQIISAVDTYRHCRPAPDGRRSPLVVLKILNAQHWMLGAQEYERMRQLWRTLTRDGASPRCARPRSHFEEGQHFCIVFDMLMPLSALQAAPAQPEDTLPATQSAFARPRPRALSSGSAPAGGGTAGLAGSLGRVLGGMGSSGASSSSGAAYAHRPCLDIETLRQAAASLLGSLAAVHRLEVIHADLKPDNIMVDGGENGRDGRRAWLTWRVVLIDFSNAMAVHEAPAYHDAFEVRGAIQADSCARAARVLASGLPHARAPLHSNLAPTSLRPRFDLAPTSL